MKKVGSVVSVFEISLSSFGKIHRGFKFEKDKRERILFYELPFSLKIPDENPQHIAVLDIIHKEQEKDFSLVCHPYISGFPLSEILKRCEKENFPLPLDQSLLIIERITSAFDLYKFGFPHPFFIWLTFDGEVKCSPIPVPKLFQKIKPDDISHYLSPQILQGDDWGRTDQVYSTGALFFELLTGKPLPLGKNEDEVIQAVVKTHLSGEGLIPKDLQVILLKSLSFKASERFQHIKDLREELGKLIYSGAYSPTTFNLAFFMHSLLRDEIEKEEKKLKEEENIDFTEILKPPKVEPEIKMPEKKEIPEIIEKPKKKNPFIFLGVSFLAIILIVFSIFIFKGQKKEEIHVPAVSKEAEKIKKLEEEYKKKLEELEIEKQKQKEELERLKKEALKSPEAKKELEKKLEEQKKTEEKLKEMEQKKKEIQQQKPQEEISQKKEEIPAQLPVEEIKKEEKIAEMEKPKEKVQEEPKKTEEAPPQEVKKTSVKEGDLVPMDQIDIAPVPIEQVQPETPPIAKVRKISAKVTLKVLVNHKGEVENVEIISINTSSNVGFDKVSIDAAKKWKFQPAIKDGIRVRCWFIIRFNF